MTHEMDSRHARAAFGSAARARVVICVPSAPPLQPRPPTPTFPTISCAPVIPCAFEPPVAVSFSAVWQLVDAMSVKSARWAVSTLTASSVCVANFRGNALPTTVCPKPSTFDNNVAVCN